MTRANPLDALEDFDVKPSEEKPRPARAEIEQLAKANGFVSRDSRRLESAEAAVESRPVRKQRRYTTGRNQQLNIKATGDTIARFYALADSLDIPAGALLERAVEALEARYMPRKDS
ncbi:stability/partitioning determinant (plasmid) [Cupriavidus necator]|uniref:hypothetical protein n=1 Tax=Cupriavidus necator TaxID=106590 RepID=UPI003F73B7E2